MTDNTQPRPSKKARQLAEEIRRDICARSGGDDWFENIDDEVQEEILTAWTGYVALALDHAKAEERQRCHDAVKEICEKKKVRCYGDILTVLL